MDGSLNHDPLRNSNILQGMLNDEVLHHWIFLVGYSYFDSIFLRPTALPPYRLSAPLFTCIHAGTGAEAGFFP